jgi:sugar transferase (PEP-CTERM/EpsH1 system associated)
MKLDTRPLIVHVVHRFAIGGLENGVVNLINRLPESRWRHGIVALTDVSQVFSARVDRRDVLYMAMNKRPGHSFHLYPKLRTLFRRHRPAIVHTRNLAALEVSVPAFLAGVPVRIHGEHGWDTGDLDGSNRRRQLIRRLYSPFVNRYVALSGQLRTYLQGSVGVDAARIVQIYNGVDSQRFLPAPDARTAIPGCPFSGPDFWLVGTVGRMQTVKNQIDLARAFVHAVRSSPSARAQLRLVVVGEGPLQGQVEAVLKDNGMRQLAWIPGERHDIPEIMRGLDCFVLPSLAEGISKTILEAMASGVPVVATRVGGNTELVDDAVTGQLVAAGEVGDMASRILRSFDHKTRAREHGKAARARVDRLFSLDRMVAAYDALYSEMLARNAIAYSKRKVA